MMHLEKASSPISEAVKALEVQLSSWLRERALPTWDTYGVDRESGGYYEEMFLTDGGLIQAVGDVRRGRVLARQLFVFDLGHRVGWRSPLGDPVSHGVEYLFAHCRTNQGLIHTAVDATTHQPGAEFSLYEQAFYLFALARIKSNSPAHFDVEAAATSCLEQLRQHYARPSGGFEESNPPTVPLLSNPHMHLLEAALEWIAVVDVDKRVLWIDLARELTSLCLDRFQDPATGAIREYFDENWQAMPGAEGRRIEPGHQFEWAWLLLQWASSPYPDDLEKSKCRNTAFRLLAIGENFGVDPVRGVVINEIWDDMTEKDPSAKLWPQTERLKAWCAMLRVADNPADTALAYNKIADAGRGMSNYLRTDADGLWHEVCAPNGEFPQGPSKASSFYHVACAIDVLRQTVAAQSDWE